MEKSKSFVYPVIIAVICFSAAFRNSSATIRFQDARKDVVLFSTGKGSCHGSMVQMGVRNSGTKKVNVTILKKETNSEFSTTSTIKLSGIPPGYKQPIGCGGRAGTADSLVVVYTIGAASYSN
jgi:hypothetical protein